MDEPNCNQLSEDPNSDNSDTASSCSTISSSFPRTNKYQENKGNFNTTHACHIVAWESRKAIFGDTISETDREPVTRLLSCCHNLPIKRAQENLSDDRINDHAINKALVNPEDKLNSEQTERARAQLAIIITKAPEFGVRQDLVDTACAKYEAVLKANNVSTHEMTTRQMLGFKNDNTPDQRTVVGRNLGVMKEDMRAADTGLKKDGTPHKGTILGKQIICQKYVRDGNKLLKEVQASVEHLDISSTRSPDPSLERPSAPNVSSAKFPSPSPSSVVLVKEHVRSNGTVVAAYTRSSPSTADNASNTTVTPSRSSPSPSYCSSPVSHSSIPSPSSSASSSAVSVSGYTRSNGTFVQSYSRSSPSSSGGSASGGGRSGGGGGRSGGGGKK